MAGIPHVTAMRTISLFGLSDVKVQFTYDFTYDEAEQRVINRLSPAAAAAQRRAAADLADQPDRRDLPLPRGRAARLFGHRPEDPRRTGCWSAASRRCPASSTSPAGAARPRPTRSTIDQRQADRLRPDAAAGAAGAEQQQHQCRRPDGQFRPAGRGRARRRPDPLDRRHPQHHADVDQRRAGAGRATSRRSGRPPAAPGHRRPGRRRRHRPGHRADAPRRRRACRPSSAVEAEVDKINSSGILPPGVHIETIYDRSDLINVTTHTVLHNMVVGIVLIFLVQWVFLGNLRSALIVAATIPFALFFAIGLMLLRGRIGQPAVGRRDRLRPDRRCHRDHGGEHLPPPGASARRASRRRSGHACTQHGAARQVRA